MEYCSSLFTSAAKTHLKKLDTIQRIAARIICDVPRDTHAEPLLIFLQLDHQVIEEKRLTYASSPLL